MDLRWSNLFEIMKEIRDTYNQFPKIPITESYQIVISKTGYPITKQEFMHIITFMDQGPPLPKIRKKKKPKP